MVILLNQGFRKVDPDRWEFAHESFLRGQWHLLKNITRRKSQRNPDISLREDIKQERSVLFELTRLKQEQRALDEEVEGMNRRLQAAEKKPQQMMAFLAKVAEDPDILSRMLLEKEASMQLGEKKRRSRIASTSAVERSTKDKKDNWDVPVVQPTVIRPLVDRSLDNDGDLYTLVNSATSVAAGTMATTSQHNGNNQSRRTFFDESNPPQPYLFRDSY